MIQTIIDALDAAIALHLPAVARHGLAELMPLEGGITQPVVYASNGSFTQIANDNAGTFSYWRYLGKDTSKGVDIPGSACGGFEVTMPLRFVAMVDRSICPNVQNVARAASWAAMDTDGAILSVTNAMIVNFTASATDTDSRRVYQAEFGKALDNADKAFVAIDITVAVTGMPECFDPCERTGSFLCQLIQAKTWAQIQQCLTDAQEAAAIGALCDVDLCELLNAAPTSEGVACMEANGQITNYLCGVIASDVATADLIVECIGNAGKTAAVEALLCDACPYDGIIQINGVQVGTFGPFDPCVDNTLNIVLT